MTRRTFPVEIRQARPIRTVTVRVRGASCPRCGNELAEGTRALVGEDGALVHRAGDERCTPTVRGRIR